jgi:DNA-binding CsgD family transcriptional regulator
MSRPLRCPVRVLEGACLFHCKLDEHHGGAHVPRHDPKIIAAVKHDLEILALRDRGKSQQWVANYFGISRTRVKQRERRAVERLRRVGAGL